MNNEQNGRLIGQGRTAEVYELGEGRVLKLFREDCRPEWVWHEIEVAGAVSKVGLPAPAFLGVVGLETDGPVVRDPVPFDTQGRTGIVYERITGPSMLQVTLREPWRLAEMARRFADLHARIHAFTVPSLPSQREQLSRMIDRAPRLSPTEKETVLHRLEALPGGEAVCHGDYHPDNVILSVKGPVVIDWMTASRGDPIADVARTSLLFRMGSLPPGIGPLRRTLTQMVRGPFLSVYLRRYARAAAALCPSSEPFDKARLEEWSVPLAAARLAEGLTGEEDRLLALVSEATRL